MARRPGRGEAPERPLLPPGGLLRGRRPPPAGQAGLPGRGAGAARPGAGPRGGRSGPRRGRRDRQAHPGAAAL